jgi:hypothetical protein
MSDLVPAQSSAEVSLQSCSDQHVCFQEACKSVARSDLTALIIKALDPLHKQLLATLE